jgi:anti-sigma regulatory factor (Ser/Thr protein kinase)
MHCVRDRSHQRSFSEVRVARPESVPQLRRALVAFARAAGAEPQQCEAVQLAVSEAVTNVVLHAYGHEGGLIHVSARLAGTELWVLIGDDGRGLNAPSRRPGLGQGLALIGAVSDSIAVLRRPSGGTELRLRFALHPCRAPAPRRRHAVPREGELRRRFAA